MKLDAFSSLRDSLDIYLLRCVDRSRPSRLNLCELAVELISNYHDVIGMRCGEVPEKAADHLRKAGEAAERNLPPVVARELDAALAVVERLQGEAQRKLATPVSAASDETT
jgi:hypothetical protein